MSELDEAIACVEENAALLRSNGSLELANLADLSLQGLRSLRDRQAEHPEISSNGTNGVVGGAVLIANGSMAGVFQLEAPVSGSELKNAVAPFHQVAAHLAQSVKMAADAFWSCVQAQGMVFRRHLSQNAVEVVSCQGDDLAIPEGLAPEFRQHFRVVRELIEQQQRYTLAKIQDFAELADAMKAIAKDQIIELRDSMLADLKRIELDDSDAIERKYRLIGAMLLTGPPTVGLAIDQFLTPFGIPGVGTAVGIAGTLIERVFVEGRLKAMQTSEESVQRQICAVLASTVILPSVGAQLGNLYLATQLMHRARAET
jgi:hypothetical protein